MSAVPTGQPDLLAALADSLDRARESRRSVAVPEAQDGRTREGIIREVLRTHRPASDDGCLGCKWRYRGTAIPSWPHHFEHQARVIEEALRASAAVREGERERLAAAVERAMRIPTHAPGDGSKYDLGREFGYNLARRQFRAALAPSLAAPEGTEQ